MTLQKSILIAFAAITLTSLSAGAYIVPGQPRPSEPPPEYPPVEGSIGGIGGGVVPGAPGGPGGIPGGIPGGLPIGQPGYPNYGRQEQKVIYLNRRVVNENISLTQLAGIGANYRGYTLDSVVVNLRSTDYNVNVALLADGREEDRLYSPQGSVQLRPRYRAVIGDDIRNLDLQIYGGVTFVDSIVVNLIDNGRPGRPGPGRPLPGRGVDVPVYVSRRLIGNDRLDIGQYVNLNAYRGYRIQEVVIDATPVYNTALLDLLINGFQQGQTLQLDRYNSRQSVRPQNAVIGQGADSLVLYTRGDLDVRGITLRLSR